MRLLGLKAKNIKILKAVDIDFKDKGVVYISGKNDQGKSTIIDLIHIALAGKSHYKDQTKMRNKDASDEDEAFVIADLDEYTVKRWFKASGNDYIEIKNKDDIKQGSPETLLSKFYSDHCRNPQEMAEMSKEDQVSFLYSLMGIEDKIQELDEEYDEIYMERRDINRDLKKAKGHFESLEEPDENLPEKVDVSEASKKLTKAQEFNSKYENAKNEIANLEQTLIPDNQEQIDNAEAEVKRLEERLKKAKESLKVRQEKMKKLQTRLTDGKKWLSENEKIDTEPIQQKIDKAEEINALHDHAEKYAKAKQEVDDLETDSQEKTDHLEQIDKKKQDLLDSNDLPIEGVSVRDGELFKDGLPVSQFGTAESIKFWSKLYIANNPRLRLLTLHRGESLDSDNQKELEEFAEENDVLFIVEMVDESEKTGVVIENGMVKRNNS